MSNDIVVMPDAPETIVTIPVQPVPVIETAKLGVLYHAPLATTLTPGIVQIGAGLLVSGGLVTLDQAFIKIEQISLNGNIIEPDENKTVNLLVDKTEVGLPNVDNTADLDKPVSTATALELNKKFDKQQNIVNFGKILYIKNDGTIGFKQENVAINDEAFVDVTLNTTTGILTFTRLNGQTTTIDFPLEELVSDGYYDTTTEEIVLVLANGNEIRFSASVLVNIYEGDGSTIMTYVDQETGANKIKVSDAVINRLAAVETSASNNALAITQEITDRSDADTLLQQAINLKANKTAAMGDFTVSVNDTGTVLTFQRVDVNGDNLGTPKTIDLHLESVVVSGSYDSATKKIILTLKDGSTVDFSIADLISGLQSEITSANKLSADLVDDTNSTNKFVTSAEKAQISTNATNIAGLQSSKQNVITSSAKLNADLVNDTLSTNKFVSSAEKNTWNAKQNALTFDNTPTSNSDNPVKSGGVYSALSGKQDVLTFDTTPTNGSTNLVTSDGVYDALVLKADKSGAVGSFVLSINSTTYVITLQAKDVNGNNLGTAQTIDLPLESVVVSGSYDSATQKVILTLKDGSTIDFSVADLISGLQTEITSTNKLIADLVDDTNTTHKFVSATDIANWNSKQNAITSNSKLNADLVDDTGTTNKFVTASDITNWNSKQNALTFDDTPTNGSNNPVKSGGIYTALAGKQNTLVAGTNITIDPTTNTISATGGASITVDSALSTTSENPVQNKVITEAINTAQNTADGAVAKNTEQDLLISALQNGKVDKVTGKQLSTEDFTTEEKTKLAGLSNYDDTQVQADIYSLQNNTEKVVNKTSTIDENSTATQYPSASAVYNELANLLTKIQNIQAVNIRNILSINNGVIEVTASTIQSVCTQYIVDNYNRQPQTLDGLIITLTDSGNDKVQYMYSESAGGWVDLGTAAATISNADSLNPGIMKLYTNTGTNTDGTITQNAITNAVSEETNNRINADATLQNNINAEATARDNADTAIINALNGKEDTSNKVTTLSNTATGTQYPSAKCVYDALQNLQAKIPVTYSEFFDFYTLANKGDASVTANRELYINTVSFTAPKGTKVHIVAHVRTRSEINQQYHTYAFQVGLYVNSKKLLLFSSIKSDYPTIDENTLSGTFTATGGTDVIKVRLFSLNATSLTALVSALVEVSGPNITIVENSTS